LPEAVWVPNLVPLDDQLYMPQDVPENGRVIIGQSPTRQDLKNTSDLSDVVNQLSQAITEPELELDVITNTNHMECLERKRTCHIIFDHMQGYYGVSSLESLSQGKPVIAGLDDWNCRHIKEFTGTDEIPWVIARNRQQLKDKLEMLIADPNIKQSIGASGRKFMEMCWREEQVLGSLLSLYEKE
jgi:hypothetical protein